MHPLASESPQPLGNGPGLGLAVEALSDGARDQILPTAGRAGDLRGSRCPRADSPGSPAVAGISSSGRMAGPNDPARAERPRLNRMPDLATPLVAWYRGSARDLPWRRPGFDAWGVLVSEFMLQQTPVNRVIPHLEAWLHRWPTPAALAAD